MNTLKQSYIYRMFLAISNWLTKIFSESALVGFFIKDVNHEKRDTERE